MIFGCTRHRSNKFGSALVGTKIFSLDNLKASFHCSHLSKMSKSSPLYIIKGFNSAAKILLSNLSPNLSAYALTHKKMLTRSLFHFCFSTLSIHILPLP